MRVNLGDRVKDRINGQQGIAIGRTDWLYGCVRITIQPEGLKTDGTTLDNVTIDEPQCEVLEAGAVEYRPFWRGEEEGGALRATAGPRPDATRRQDPTR